MFSKDWVSDDCHVVHTDASNEGLGFVYINKWSLIPFVGDKAWLVRKPIHFREILAVCVALSTFADLLCNQKVVLMVDNQAVVHAINSGTIKCNDTMELVRSCYYIMSIRGIQCMSECIATQDNSLADALSRLDFVTFRGHHSGAEKHMSMPSSVNYYDTCI